MSDFIVVHRPFSNQVEKRVENSPLNEGGERPFLVWKTCLRQIFFIESTTLSGFELQRDDQVFVDLEAESFLAQVLCGLKSPLVGETEVFGQFKIWWKSISDNRLWKKRHQSRIEGLYALVKHVRERVLSGQGPQSYGSILRRHLKSGPYLAVDIIGNGHLAQEIAPWIQGQAYRVWCRSPQKVSFSELGKKAESILSLNDREKLSQALIVAAPLTHDELNFWMAQRGFSKDHALFDFRADSTSFVPFTLPSLHLKLGDFSTQHESHRGEIEKKARDARALIVQWQEKQKCRVQVRPYGWDDL